MQTETDTRFLCRSPSGQDTKRSLRQAQGRELHSTVRLALFNGAIYQQGAPWAAEVGSP